MCEVFKCKGSGCQFVMSTVGAVQGTVSRRKKVKIILSEQYFNLVGVLKYRNCGIVKLGFYVPSNDIICRM